MFKKYENDYYTGQITTADIIKKEKISYYKLYKLMESEGHIPYRKICDQIQTNDAELKKMLREKYANISFRCRGGSTDVYGHYEGMTYLSIIEWVEFCNKNMSRINSLWDGYFSSGKDMSFAVSIDRVDNTLGYLVDNLEFVTHGFNSWKRSTMRPIKAKQVGNDNWVYFMSCREGSRYFSIRPQDFGEILSQNKYRNNSFDVKKSTISDVLKNKNINSLQEYYIKYCQNK